MIIKLKAGVLLHQLMIKKQMNLKLLQQILIQNKINKLQQVQPGAQLVLIKIKLKPGVQILVLVQLQTIIKKKMKLKLGEALQIMINSQQMINNKVITHGVVAIMNLKQVIGELLLIQKTTTITIIMKEVDLEIFEVAAMVIITVKIEAEVEVEEVIEVIEVKMEVIIIIIIEEDIEILIVVMEMIIMEEVLIEDLAKMTIIKMAVDLGVVEEEEAEEVVEEEVVILIEEEVEIIKKKVIIQKVIVVVVGIIIMVEEEVNLGVEVQQIQIVKIKEKTNRVVMLGAQVQQMIIKMIIITRVIMVGVVLK